MSPPRQTPVAILVNLVVALVAPLPSYYAASLAWEVCAPDGGYAGLSPNHADVYSNLMALASDPFSTEAQCRVMIETPVAAVIALFFVNVVLGFWALSWFQGNGWLIDLYWTVIPVLTAHFHLWHPLAVANPRAIFATVLIWAWSIRLTHSYLRREEYQLGAAEDWRYADMRRDFGILFPAVIAFFAVYVVNEVFIVGITLPLAAVAYAWDAEAAAPPAFNNYDIVAVVMCVAGMATAMAADNQLRAFMVANEARAKRGEPKVLLLNTGVWYYSRHPNYFGEQLFWWGLAVFAANVGQAWMFVGPALNSLCLAIVTFMTEKRILLKKEREALYREYQRTTSPLLPWPKYGGGMRIKQD